ncbi:alternative splicing regulator, putative [Plasmodium ovale wallikeri]|uniref:Alternative splicing regulator, putative n=2 Tax=Plasmodium ovale TaxID=36330 RepID=A0A1A8ZTK4_PLAOA|nr:alternative splicing regulator, putative [Plasmodium ovale wallikeri]SBT47700.1 alternative splicing regulator, putative [Plasmodium ovale wallikeri]
MERDKTLPRFVLEINRQYASHIATLYIAQRNRQMSDFLNVSATDVVRLILQYLRENNLMRSFYVLQEESNIKLNAASNVDVLLSDINKGDWKNVLFNITTVDLSDDTLMNLYEQLICELVEYKEKELAEKIMNECIIFKRMEKKYTDKYAKLIDVVSSNGVISKSVLYDGMTKEEKRKTLCAMINNEITSCAPSRLLALLGMALKWQNHHNIIKNKNGDFDIFRNVEKDKIQTIDVYPEKVVKSIHFGNDSNVECCICSYINDYLITGTSDGFIEIWNWYTAQLNIDLTYQRENNIMMHDNPIVSLCVSKDDEILISGDSKGFIKIWRIKTGSCLRQINAHTNAITSIHFNKDQTQLLTSSYDSSVKIHGLKSLKCLKEFTKHTTVVNSAIYTLDNSKVICATDEGKIYVYNQKNCECISSFYVFYNIKDNVTFPAVNSVILIRKNYDDLILVCSKSPYCYIMNLKGQIIKTYTNVIDKNEEESVHFVSACISPNFKYVYCMGENQHLYCFDYNSAKLEVQVKIHERDSLGVLHSHTQNFMAAWALDGTLSIIQ